jgi:hypothetical protein
MLQYKYPVGFPDYNRSLNSPVKISFACSEDFFSSEDFSTAEEIFTGEKSSLLKKSSLRKKSSLVSSDCSCSLGNLPGIYTGDWYSLSRIYCG